MKKLSNLLILLPIGVLAATSISSSTTPTREITSYRVDQIQGKLILESAVKERRLDVGEELSGGQVLRTGWFSEAELSVESLATRFHLGNRTRVELASDTPGMILRINKGRARLIFDRLVGDTTPERQVETPSALLAVRGTEYGVSVDRKGHTVLVVFDGIVDVSHRDSPGDTVRVEAGFSLRILASQPIGAPSVHGISRGAWDHGSMPSYHGSMTPGHEGMGDSGHTRSPTSGHPNQGGGHHGG